MVNPSLQTSPQPIRVLSSSEGEKLFARKKSSIQAKKSDMHKKYSEVRGHEIRIQIADINIFNTFYYEFRQEVYKREKKLLKLRIPCENIWHLEDDWDNGTFIYLYLLSGCGDTSNLNEIKEFHSYLDLIFSELRNNAIPKARRHPPNYSPQKQGKQKSGSFQWPGNIKVIKNNVMVMIILFLISIPILLILVFVLGI